PPPLTGGGMDDRFDFEIATGELFDGAGLDYAAGTYHALANNGSVPMNQSINYFSNTALSELPNRQQVLDLLTTVSDRLPVVAEYAVMLGGPGPTRTSRSGEATSATLAALGVVPLGLRAMPVPTCWADVRPEASQLAHPRGKGDGTLAA